MSNNASILHASCVSVADQGCLILGGSGSGKSALALSMIAYGATLVADDRVILTRIDNAVMASAPDPLRGLIEARGVGILTCDVAKSVAIRAVVDLDSVETERLPQVHETELLGQAVALLRRVDGPHFAPALMQYLRSGRHSP